MNSDLRFAEHYEELYPIAFNQFLEQGYDRAACAQLAEKQSSLAAFRIMCRTDLSFLATEVFKMHEGRNGGRKIWDDNFHIPLVQALEDPEDALIWMSRHMLKSTFVEIYCVQQIIDDPVNVVIMLGSESMGLGRKKLLNIKRRLKHPKLLMAFSDRLIANDKKWEKNDQDALTITRAVADEDGGTREIPPAEPQIRVFGMETAVTGDHPTHIVFDDFITEKNVTTAVQIEKAVMKFEAVMGMCGLVTVTKMVGTPWHPMDLNHHVIENEIIEKVVQLPGAHMEGAKEVLDYKWYTKDFLRKQKKKMRHRYWPQFHLDTRPREDRIFKPPYPVWDKLPEKLEYYIGVDPSTGKTEEHDKSGIVVGAVDPENTSRLYLLEAEGYSLEAEELAEVVLDRILRYSPNRLAIELGQQAAILTVLRLKAQEKMKSVAIDMPEIVEISTGGGSAGSKWEKIEGTAGIMMRDQRIWLAPGMTSLRLQMELFDRNKQKNDDDILDALRDCILAVPYFSHGMFDTITEKEVKPLTWKKLVESISAPKSDRDRMFAN